MSEYDSLKQMLLDFFDLPKETSRDSIKQERIGAWDSLAMVQLIAELQSHYRIQFEIDEIEQLTSYEEIKTALIRKQVTF